MRVGSHKIKSQEEIMSQENINVAQRAYNSFKSGDIESLLDLMSDDVTWQLPDIEGVPFAGKRAGREAVARFFASVNESQEVLEFSPKEFVAQGDKVVALGHCHWRVRSTGREFASDFAHDFTVRDGRIVAFHEYLDTAVAAYQKAQTA